MENRYAALSPDKLTPEERLDALAEVLAEGILHLAENDEPLPRPAAETSSSLERRSGPVEVATEAGGSLRKTA